MTWDAINHAGQNYNAPTIDYDRFNARWETDPVLKQLVARFDGHGVVIKTDKKEPKPNIGEPNLTKAVDKMAKHATQQAFK
jgi:hypothetical protein